jgi:Zn-finger nucleic acid-binding protein
MGSLIMIALGVTGLGLFIGVSIARQRRIVRTLEAETADLPERLGRCPVCEDEELVAKQASGEQACAACKGCLLAPDRARDLVFMPRGITPGALKAVGTGQGVAQSCPSCGGAMRPVLVDDDVIDVCLHCGAVWCDEDELPRLLRSDAFAR